MKRSLILLTIILTVLVGCGQKKETKSKASKQSIDSTLPVIANAEKETVVTKKLSFPKTAEGVQQTQTITYKGNQFLGLTIEQILPMKEELKKVVGIIGIFKILDFLNLMLEMIGGHSLLKSIHIWIVKQVNLLGKQSQNPILIQILIYLVVL